MNLRISALITAFALATILGNAQSLAQNAYITNTSSDTVSVIDTATNTVTATMPSASFPRRGGDPGRQQGLCHEQFQTPAPCR